MKRNAFQCPLPSALAAVLMLALPARTDEPKNHDHDVVREESRVAPFHLPPLTVTAEGTPVTTAGQWLNQRRPQVMGLFANLLYGSVPEPSSLALLGLALPLACRRRRRSTQQCRA